jgi:hypothetical protein
VATYYDTGFGANSGNMSAGSLFAGPTSSGVTVRRTTNDGNFLIEHKWSRDTTERDLTLQMAITNTSGAAIPSVKVLRIVDVDANGDTSNSGYDKSFLGTWIRKTDAVGVAGLTLNLAPITAITIFTTSVTCTPASVPVPAVGDAMAWVGYDFGSIGSGSKKTVKFGYQVQ